MTFVDGKYVMWESISMEVLAKSAKFIQPANQFTRFASYLMSSANDIKFAINSGNAGHRIFQSNLNTLKDYSDTGIKAWQKDQIKEFSLFLHDHKARTNASNQEKIEQFQSLVSNELELNTFINSFDTKRYREGLLGTLITQNNILAIEEFLKHVPENDINAALMGKDTTALKMAAQQGHTEIVKLLLKNGANDSISMLAAACEGHKDTVQLLLDNGADINHQTAKTGETALIAAARNGHQETVELLIGRGANVNQEDHDGRTAFLHAAYKGHKDTVQLLLDNGANIEQISKSQELSALHVAADQGHTETVKLLLERGADINQVDKRGINPLSYSLLSEHSETVKLLLEKGANINPIKEEYKEDIFFKAVFHGHAEIVQVMLANGMEVNQANEAGITPLIMASKGGHQETIKSLLDSGADINQVYEKKNETALYIVSREGHTEATKLLLENGADINLANKEGLTPLMIASMKGRQEIAQLLLEKNADIQLNYPNGRSILMMAFKANNVEIAKLLSAKGAKVSEDEIEDLNDMLLFAVESGHKEQVNLFLENGADAKQVDSDGETLLYKSAINDDKEMFKLLLERGNILDEDQQRSLSLMLHSSVLDGDKEMTQFLLEKGADINKGNVFGKTVLQIEDKQPMLVEAANAAILTLAKEDKNQNIQQIISAFPEDKRMEYFADSIQKITIEYAKQKNTSGIDLVLSAFPAQGAMNASFVQVISGAISKIIKEDNALTQDNSESWKLVERMLQNSPEKHRVAIVRKALKEIDTSRKDKLLNFLPKEQRGLASASPSGWQAAWRAVCETANLVSIDNNKLPPQTKKLASKGKDESCGGR